MNERSKKQGKTESCAQYHGNYVRFAHSGRHRGCEGAVLRWSGLQEKKETGVGGEKNKASLVV